MCFRHEMGPERTRRRRNDRSGESSSPEYDRSKEHQSRGGSALGAAVDTAAYEYGEIRSGKAAFGARTLSRLPSRTGQPRRPRPRPTCAPSLESRKARNARRVGGGDRSEPGVVREARNRGDDSNFNRLVGPASQRAHG